MQREEHEGVPFVDRQFDTFQERCAIRNLDRLLERIAPLIQPQFLA